MKILVVGAGVIGSIYGGRLAESGHAVDVLARGKRLAELEREGLVLENIVDGSRSGPPVRVVATPGADPCDLVLVALRDGQITSALPLLDALPGRPDILFFSNCPLRVAELVGRFGADRTFFGFAGAGGVHDGGTIRYAAVRQQATTFGPVLGASPARPAEIAAVFAAAGFAVERVPDMEAWLMTHAFFITAICGALYRNGGRSAALAGNRADLALMRRGLSEGLACVRALGKTPSPAKFDFLADYLPEWLVVAFLRRFFASKLAEFAIDGHANAAADDMADLAADCRTMIAEAGIAAPTVDVLAGAVEAYAGRRNA